MALGITLTVLRLQLSNGSFTLSNTRSRCVVKTRSNMVNMMRINPRTALETSSHIVALWLMFGTSKM